MKLDYVCLLGAVQLFFAQRCLSCPPEKISPYIYDQEAAIVLCRRSKFPVQSHEELGNWPALFGSLTLTLVYSASDKTLDFTAAVINQSID